MRAYPEDLRERIVSAVARGKHPDEVAELFAVSSASVRRSVRQQREEGHLRSALPPGRPRRLSPAHEATLREQLTTQPNASLAELGKRLATATGEQVQRDDGVANGKALGLDEKKDPSGE